METKSYSLTGKTGPVSLTLEAMGPGEFPPVEKVQEWYSRYCFPRFGHLAIDGYAPCRTPQKSYQLRGRGGKATSVVLDKVGTADGNFPEQAALQNWFESKDFPAHALVEVSGAAPCVLTS